MPEGINNLSKGWEGKGVGGEKVGEIGWPMGWGGGIKRCNREPLAPDECRRLKTPLLLSHLFPGNPRSHLQGQVPGVPGQPLPHHPRAACTPDGPRGEGGD